MITFQLHEGDCLSSLKTIPDESVACCVTSPPYFGLRDYGHEAQIGLETTPDAYVAKIVEVFREVRRVMKKDGTLWLNLGDSYAGSGRGLMGDGTPSDRGNAKQGTNRGTTVGSFVHVETGLKPKDLIGIPWRVAFALQADGWWLRQDIIWHKSNPMPESVRDRCTKAHEYIFLLTKSERYFYNYENAMEPVTSEGRSMRNRRSVWSINTEGYKGAHFATFPSEIPRLCIMAGTKAGDTVLDPFGGSGTTGSVAIELGRSAILCELNPDFAQLIRQRCSTTIGFAF